MPRQEKQLDGIGPTAAGRTARPGAELRAGLDPRIPFAFLLTLYAALGCTVLRFNRDPGQMLLTVASACLLDLALAWGLRRRRISPLSAYISGLSLALLLNYSHNYYLLFLPVFFTIGSKYLVTYEGKHFLNPSLLGVVLCLLFGGDLITTAPAYQWGGGWAMSAFLLMAALSLFVLRIGRGALIVSFLGFYVLQILLRAWIMRHHLPPETLVLGTLTSAPFFLFVFYMITDPKTSPPRPRQQVAVAFAITVVDLYLHRLESLYTFYYAAFIVAGARFLFLHARRAWGEGLRVPPATRRAAAVLAAIGLTMAAVYRGVIHPSLPPPDPSFRLEAVPRSVSGLGAEADGSIFALVDPRLQHIAKWVLSVGDSAAAGDFDGDGRLDLVLTQPLKPAGDRLALYRNLGGFRFERVRVPAFEAIAKDPAGRGMAANAVFADYDNDGDQDLLLSIAFGRGVLLRNLKAESGSASFVEEPGFAASSEHTVSIAANWLDFDKDGKLDLFIANALRPRLLGYEPPRELSLFRLPAPEYDGDRRMFPFMHESWDDSANGGLNLLYRNAGGGRFEKLDAAALGMPETHWSMAAGTGDLNRDGWTDLYVANDFGPDDVYLNRAGKSFARVAGKFFGSIGKDTYKGMNASLGDFDRNGWLDIHVSNVHMPLQAEGSLLWMLYPSKDPFVPVFRDEATRRGALNERRFGWGAAVGDLNRDGWLDMVQANGMVDDSLDKRFERCKDYWYVNEKIMRSGPEIHAYADMWGDIRGHCINPRDLNRVYLSRGDRDSLQFVDVADRLGWKAETPSRGVVMADFDDDGDLDVAITRMIGAVSLYENTLGAAVEPPRHWIGFSLAGDGVSCNKDAAGTKITVRSRENGKVAMQMREIAVVNGFNAQSDRRALFGLGEAGGPVDAEISWCGAAPLALANLAVDRYHGIRQ